MHTPTVTILIEIKAALMYITLASLSSPVVETKIARLIFSMDESNARLQRKEKKSYKRYIQNIYCHSSQKIFSICK